MNRWPAGTRTADMQQTVPGLHVTWEGTCRAAHRRAAPLPPLRLELFQGVRRRHAKCSTAGGRTGTPGTTISTSKLAAGQPHKLRIEWEPDSGYIALLHNDPRPEPDRHSLTLSSDFARAVDYYFVPGSSMDDVIAGYRELTGKAPILPKWAYGFWQSRQRYETQDQLLGVLHEYRKRGLPLDNIVQDWLYWPQDQWGCQCFDAARFPDPKAMVDDVHANGAHVMISVWAKFYKGTAELQCARCDPRDLRPDVEPTAGRAEGPQLHQVDVPRLGRPRLLQRLLRRLQSGGARPLLEPGPAGHRKQGVRRLVARFRRAGLPLESLDRPRPHGEWVRRRSARPSPISTPIRWCTSTASTTTRSPTSPTYVRSSSRARASRASSGTAPPSGRATSRRAGTTCASRSRRALNFSLSGDPNWSHDIGGYTMEPRFQKPTPPTSPSGASSIPAGSSSAPSRRSSAATARTSGARSSRCRRRVRRPMSSMAWYDRLRYRLMPYIYTLGADTYFNDGTIMRALVMDFAADRKTWGVADEYMFGPAFLVAPVAEYRARRRKVYLPGGLDLVRFLHRPKHARRADDHRRRALRANATVRPRRLDRPDRPAIQHTGKNSHSPVTLDVYTGANGSFSLYEDDGVSRQYLHGNIRAFR